MAKELNENSGFQVSIKTLVGIGVGMATVISMWFMLQALCGNFLQILSCDNRQLPHIPNLCPAQVQGRHPRARRSGQTGMAVAFRAREPHHQLSLRHSAKIGLTIWHQAQPCHFGREFRWYQRWHGNPPSNAWRNLL